jgi:hypothetical protein
MCFRNKTFRELPSIKLAFPALGFTAGETLGFVSTKLLAFTDAGSSGFAVSSVPSWFEVSCAQNASALTGPLARAATSWPLKYVHPSAIGALRFNSEAFQGKLRLTRLNAIVKDPIHQHEFEHIQI